MTAPKAPDVSTPSGAHTRMTPRWILIDRLLGGTEAMRAAGREHMPQHEHETDKNYLERLEATSLVNAVEDTLDTLTGRPFSEDMVLGDDMPQDIKDMMEDVDLQGTAIQPFCRNWFREGWAKGLSHVLTDFPLKKTVLDELGNARPRTLADDRAEGLRPYWVQIRPENVLAAYAEVVNGKERLIHVRILETSVERDGWSETIVERIKVLEPGTWEMWKYNPQNKKWELEENGVTGLGHIPFRTFYSAKRVGLMECKPPLTDLAHLNVTHWQSSSDQRNILTVARFPILAASGLAADAKITIGPKNFLTTEDPQGKWYYVEHAGAAIEAGAKDLETLENQMSSYGSEFLRAKPGTETATARALDSAESTSYLAATVQTFKDVVEEALQDIADWVNAETGGSVEIKGEFTEEEANQAELDTLNKARDRRDISRPAYLEELKRRKILCDDYDAEEDKALIDEEAADGLGGDMFNKGNGTVTPPADGAGE